MEAIRERYPRISEACKCVGGGCSQEQDGCVQAAGAGVGCVKDRVPKVAGGPSREGKLAAVTGSNAGWALHK